ncbi:putative periplasmic binding protein-like I [Helianthus annuus]|nr:putative periplasmic binding protein-like I [Helianthus annuus]
MLAVWAYDIIWALAESIERVGVPQNGTLLLNEILKSKFKGMGGEFRLTERNLISNGYEIVNVVDHEERKVGYWTLSKGITRTLRIFNHDALRSGIGMEDVIWPGGSTAIPKSHGKKLRIGVQTGLTFSYFVHAVYDDKNNVTKPLGFEIDGILGDSTILAKRYEFVDFTSTYTNLGLGTLAKTNRKDMWIFLKPLNANLWLTFTAFLIFNGLVIWAIEAMDQESKSSSSQRIGTIFWLIVLTIFSAQSCFPFFLNICSINV